MPGSLDSAEAICAGDSIFAGAGLEHGRRSTRAGAWHGGERVKTPRGPVTVSARSGGAPGIVRVEAWEEFPWLRAGFSTRQGGRSNAYGPNEQNLGWTDHDEPVTVAENRRRFLKTV